MSPFEEMLRAVYRHDVSAIDGAVGQGASVRDVDADGRTALMHAVLDSEHDLRTIRHLIDLGSDVNHRDTGQRWTALAFAAQDQKADVVELLLGHGAEVDPRDAFGNTPLWRAVVNHQGDDRVVHLLLGRGADPDATNDSGVSPLELARKTGKADRIDWGLDIEG